MTHPKDNVPVSRSQKNGGGSNRLGPTQSFRSDPNDHEDNSPKVRSQMGRRQSIRLAPEEDATDPPPRSNSSRCLSAGITEERSISAREAVAAQEAAEAKAAAAAAAEEEGGANGGGGPVRMSLMDLLEETDRQMGVVGSRYRMGDEDDYEDEEEEEEEEEGLGEVEHTCCVCMVRHKGAAFVPCDHTFCRLCSRELWVSKGNCPLCNNFILEILDIF